MWQSLQNVTDSDVARFSDQGGPRKYLGGGGAHCRNSNQIKTEWGNKTRTDRGFNKFVYRLSQNETKHEFETTNLYCYK